MSTSQNTPLLAEGDLILRRFSESDIPALFALYADREINKFLPWFPLETQAQAEALFREKYETFYRNPVGYRYAVCLQADNLPIGYVHLEADGAHDLGYALRREFWGQGIMTRAARMVLARAKADGMPFVTATHDRENPRSGAVMQRLGMHYAYSYTELWQLKNIPVVFRMYQINFDPAAPLYTAYRAQTARWFIEETVQASETCTTVG